MAGGRFHTSGALAVGGTSRAGMRSQIVLAQPSQKGPGWASALDPRRLPQAPGAMVAAVGLAIGSLVDNFDDNTVDTGLWVNNFGTYSETGGRARVSCDTGYNAYSSALTYTLAESSVYLRAYPPAAGGATTEAWAQILIKSDVGGTDLGFELRALTGELVMFSRTGYFDAGAVAITYSATDHLWLRVRETGGTVYWDTSPDATTWTNRRSLASPAWVSAADLEFQLIAHRSDGTNDFAEFDSLNVPPVVQLGDASLAVTAGLAAAGERAASGDAALAATAGLSATGQAAVVGSASEAATAGLTASGTRNAVADASAVVTASLSAAGTVAAAGSASAVATAGLTAEGTAELFNTASLSPTAGLTADGVRAASGDASDSVVAGLSAAGSVACAGDASLAITAGLSASLIPQVFGDATLAVAALLPAAGTVQAAADGNFSAVSGLSAAGQAEHAGGGSLTGGATLTASGIAALMAAAGLAASAVLQASGTVTPAVVPGSSGPGAAAIPNARQGMASAPAAAGGRVMVATASGGSQ